MLKINNIKMPLSYDDTSLKSEVSRICGISSDKILKLSLVRKSIDARKKNSICFILSAVISTTLDEAEERQLAQGNDCVFNYENMPYIVPKCRTNPKSRPVIVGSGPAGLFCAYVLCKSGVAPLIIEKGAAIERRVECVNRFWTTGELDEQSNVQFGEGGAGTFSDGKLNTGINDERIAFVLETFVKFGANDDILYNTKPHIGTDVLRRVTVNFRQAIENSGGEFRFETEFLRVNTKNNKLISVQLRRGNSEYTEPCETLVIATGHSARGVYESLHSSGIPLAQKPFAVGVRIEHKQLFINKTQYGVMHSHPKLPPADYKAAIHLKNGRSVFSFCMCPGGYVVNASSERGMTAINGMSNFSRNGENANSALLVNVNPADFGNNHPLAGIEFQRRIEAAAFSLTGSYKAPSQPVGEFLDNAKSVCTVNATCRPVAADCDINRILPDFIGNSLKEGIMLIDRKLKGFSHDAILTAPETRSSSPIRILRENDRQSAVSGIYPCGEGAGYAGGITSSAVDGIKTAEAIINA